MKSATFARAANTHWRAARTSRAEFCQLRSGAARAAFRGRPQHRRRPISLPVSCPEKAPGCARRRPVRATAFAPRRARPSAWPVRADLVWRAARGHTKRRRARVDFIWHDASANRHAIRNALIHHEKFLAPAFWRPSFWMCVRAQSTPAMRVIERCEDPKRTARAPFEWTLGVIQSASQPMRKTSSTRSQGGGDALPSTPQ
jgi:hypothetical protein